MLVIDNYDSFVYNLVQYLGELGAEPIVHRHDAVGIDALRALEPDAVLVSPGPGRPEDAGVSNDAIREFGAAGGPVLGVCLGHQCIGQIYGGEVVRAPLVMHGKTSRQSGTDSRATTSEWYRVAVNGSGSPANTPRPSWLMLEVLPCITCGARTTSPP